MPSFYYIFKRAQNCYKSHGLRGMCWYLLIKLYYGDKLYNYIDKGCNNIMEYDTSKTEKCLYILFSQLHLLSLGKH